MFTMHSELQKVLFLSLSVTFCLGITYLGEPLNGFAPDSQERHVWSLTRTSLKVKSKGQGHQGQKPTFFGPLSDLLAVYVW